MYKNKYFILILYPNLTLCALHFPAILRWSSMMVIFPCITLQFQNHLDLYIKYYIDDGHKNGMLLIDFRICLYPLYVTD